MVTSADRPLSRFLGEENNVLIHDCVDFAWSLVSNVTNGKYRFIVETVELFFKLRDAYDSSPLVKAFVDTSAMTRTTRT